MKRWKCCNDPKHDRFQYEEITLEIVDPDGETINTLAQGCGDVTCNVCGADAEWVEV
jgi:hypothetical protein